MLAARRFRLDHSRPHGTHYRYSTHGCRCDQCRNAEREYAQDLRRRKKTGDVWDHTSYLDPLPRPRFEDLDEPNLAGLFFGIEDLHFVRDRQRILEPDPTAEVEDLMNHRDLVYASRVDRQHHTPPFAEELDELISATKKPAVQKQARKWLHRGYARREETMSETPTERHDRKLEFRVDDFHVTVAAKNVRQEPWQKFVTALTRLLVDPHQ